MPRLPALGPSNDPSAALDSVADGRACIAACGLADAKRFVDEHKRKLGLA